jgi:2-keto-4-pentenoate hydratase
MARLTAAPDLNVMADDVLASLSSHSQIPTFSSRAAGLTVDQAYQVTALARAAFETRGEKIVGRKVGFTNREMWKVYGVRSPIWGYVTDHTVHQLAEHRFCG